MALVTGGARGIGAAASLTLAREGASVAVADLVPAADTVRQVEGLKSKARLQMGTLGGGNHFIELCLDTDNQLWVMLHSGSRNIGKELAEIHIAKAKKLAHNQNLPDRDLAVLLAGTPEMQAYRHDLFWAQRYARANREVMLEQVIQALREHFPWMNLDQPIHCHHNYVARETHYREQVYVTRKGAVRAGPGQLGIIPGSMGARSFIVSGKGNPESFESCSHGAGRVMSRTEARRRFTVADHVAATQGVECRKDASVIDETPMAYKPIDAVMAAQADLVEIRHTLRQIVCVKG